MELFAGKKAAYAEYRKLRDVAQELSVAVRNIASLYEAELQEQQKIKEENFFISGKVKKIDVTIDITSKECYINHREM